VFGARNVGFFILSFRRKASDVQRSELLVALAQQATLAVQLTRLAYSAKEAAVLVERTRIGQEIHDDGPPLWVLEARDIAARLVEEQIRGCVARADGAAVERDTIGRGIGLRSGLEAHHAVDRDAAGGEKGLSPPS